MCVKDGVCYCSDKKQTLLHIHAPFLAALRVTLTTRQAASSWGIFSLTLWDAASAAVFTRFAAYLLDQQSPAQLESAVLNVRIHYALKW